MALTKVKSSMITPDHHEVWLTTGNGYGSEGSCKARRFANSQVNTGTAITYLDDATHGAKFTVNEDGLYSISYCDWSWNGQYFGVGVDCPTTTAYLNLDENKALMGEFSRYSAAALGTCAGIFYLTAGQVIRCITAGGTPLTESNVSFRILKVD